jgi:benzoyl-CoA reductase/2-hydroxyglutaryl-CoA dehydratase subunit BcrC/BadD/HgdB
MTVKEMTVKDLRKTAKRFNKKRLLIAKIINMVERAKGLPPNVGSAIFKTTSNAITNGTTMWE